MNKKVKLIGSVLLGLILLAGIGACGKKGTKVLRIGTHADYPPFESNQGAAFVGVDIDLARKIAEKLDMEYKIVDMDFDTLFPSLNSNKIDLAISAITINEERKAQVEFSAPYYLANQVIIAKPDNKLILNKIDDIGKFVVGAQKGTTGETFLTENYVDKKLMPTDNLKIYPTSSEAIADMLSGKIDFVIIDDSAAQGYSQQKPIVVVQKIETNENYGIALPKGGELNAKINQALQELLDSGEVISLIQTHIQ